MNVVALLSGGKDSLFNLYLSTLEGHKTVAIANLKPPAGKDELDSYMYQTVGHQAIDIIAAALNKPLFRANITGTVKNKDLEYTETIEEDDEVEQLYCLLRDMRQIHGIHFDAVSVGAIASSYQKHRVESICKRLNLTMLAYLWNENQDVLLQRMIDNNFDAILIKVACMGLTSDHIGKSIKSMQPTLRKLEKDYGTNICGEGGEYETLVLDCPLYEKRVVIDKFDIVCHSPDIYAPVYFMRPLVMHLDDK